MSNIHFQVLRDLVELYGTLAVPDYMNICRCLVFLDDANGLAEILLKLVNSGTENDVLLGYQIAFELIENATQEFLARVRHHISESTPSKSTDDVRILLLHMHSIEHHLHFAVGKAT